MLTSLRMIISGSVHVAANGVISFLFITNIPFFFNVLHLLYPLICLWAFRWFPCLGCCKECCCEPKSACYLFELAFAPNIFPGLGLLDRMVATVEVKNRFKGLDLIDRVPDELWNEVRDIVQETGIKTILMEKKCKKSKMAVWERHTNSCERKRSEKQRRKVKIKASEYRVPKNSKKR